MFPKSLFVVVLLYAASAVSAQDPTENRWSSFQNGGQLTQNAWDLPTEWSPESGVAWKLELPGYGQSCPVVFGTRVYVTSVTGGNKETWNLQAISIEDGKQLWMVNAENSSPEKNTVMVSRAAPTPVVDDAGVYAFFEGGNLLAVDHAGKSLWQRDLTAEFGPLKARHGLAASLEQDADHLFLWAERMESPFVLAISKRDGKTVWKSDGLGGTSWSSPRMITVAGQKQLVLSASGVVAALDPTSGKRLWEFRDIGGNSSTTPVPVGDGRILMGASLGRDGASTSPSCGVLEIKPDGESFSVAWAWQAPKASCSFGSPMATAERAYFVTRSGIVHCHDLKTGKSVFVDRLPAGQIWATPLATREGIYFFGKEGLTTVIADGSELKTIAENELWTPAAQPAPSAANPGGQFSGSVLYGAAVAPGTLVLRRGDVLYAVR